MSELSKTTSILSNQNAFNTNFVIQSEVNGSRQNKRFYQKAKAKQGRKTVCHRFLEERHKSLDSVYWNLRQNIDANDLANSKTSSAMSPCSRPRFFLTMLSCT